MIDSIIHVTLNMPVMNQHLYTMCRHWLHNFGICCNDVKKKLKQEKNCYYL